MGLQPAGRAFTSEELKFQHAGLTAKHTLGQFLKLGPILRQDERIDALVGDLFEGVGFDHLQAGGVHLEQRAVRAEQFHAFRFGFDDRAQAKLAPPERRHRFLALRDVLRHTQDAGDPAVGVPDKREVIEDPDQGAVLAVFERFHLA